MIGRYRVADRLSWNAWVNASLVDTGETTLASAGMLKAVDDFRGELDEAGYDAGDIDRMLLTHFELNMVPREAGRTGIASRCHPEKRNELPLRIS